MVPRLPAEAGNRLASTSCAAVAAAAIGEPVAPAIRQTIRLVALLDRLDGVVHGEMNHGVIDQHPLKSSRRSCLGRDQVSGDQARHSASTPYRDQREISSK